MALSDGQRAALAARLRNARREVAPEAAVGDGTCRLVELTPESDRPTLFALHAIGGSVYAYAHLARELADRYRLVGIEAGGLVPGTTPAVTLAQMVANYVRAIRTARPAGPYRLLGWSMGGMIAFEVARSLEGQGERVSLLALLDTPFRIDPRTLASPEALEALFTSDVAGILGWDRAPDGVERQEWLAVRLDAGAGRIEEARAEIGRRFAVLTANARLINGYRPRDPIAAPAVMASAAESRPRHTTGNDSSAAWSSSPCRPTTTRCCGPRTYAAWPTWSRKPSRRGRPRRPCDGSARLESGTDPAPGADLSVRRQSGFPPIGSNRPTTWRGASARAAASSCRSRCARRAHSTGSVPLSSWTCHPNHCTNAEMSA